MGNPLDSAAFVRLLDTRLREVSEAKYKDLPTMIPKLYRMLSSDSAWEEFYSVGAVPDISEFNGRLSYLPVYPGYHTRIEPKEYAGGLQSERKLFDDKKYSVLDGRAEGLMESAQRVREKKGALPFTQAFSTAFHYQSSEEGVSLCSSSHTTKSGTSTTSGFDNSGTDALNKTSVAATRLAMRLFRNDISERIEVGDDLALIVPDNLADTAFELVRTPKGMDSAEGNVNMAYGRYEVIPYLRLDDSDTNNWFMVWKSQMKKDLVFIDRIKAELENTVDFETKMMKHSVYMRLACGFLDWRFIFGHVVS
uniref:Putative capsid protein n=1 Tax=viral metagenome TaxID=1070528 RepID=A0A6M3KE18_9ZZZZ